MWTLLQTFYLGLVVLTGAVLASPVDTHMTNALMTYIRAKQVDECGIFTGVHATFSPGDFFSVEGVPLNSMPVEWMPEEPNNLQNNEQCIAFFGNGTIADVDCTAVFPYVCFKKYTKAPVTACGTIDTEYVLNPKTGNCYKFHRDTRTWSRAYMSCAAEGGYLAIPNSEEEAMFMKDLFNKNPANKIIQVHEAIMRDIMHIGFLDWGERTDWRTIQGQTLEEAGYSRFLGGQPDNFTGGEFCGGMFRSGYLDDLWCHEVGPYMCEKSPAYLVDDQ